MLSVSEFQKLIKDVENPYKTNSQVAFEHGLSRSAIKNIIKWHGYKVVTLKRGHYKVVPKHVQVRRSNT